MLIFLCILLTSSLASASDYTFKVDSNTTLFYTCLDTANNYCDSTTIVSINVNYPNGSLALNNISMTHNPTFYNVTLPTSLKGEYNAIILSPGNINITEEFTYLVNPQGIPPSDARTSTLTRTIYFSFLLALMLFVGSLLSENLTIKISLMLVSILFLVVGINFIGITLQDEIVNPQIENFFASFTAMVFYIYLAIFIAMAVLWIFSIINTSIMRNKQAIQARRNFG